MIYPEFLKKGDCIGVPAPSGGADTIQRENKIKHSKQVLENLGYNIKLSENLSNGYRGRSSSTQNRAKEINEMFQNKDINMILSLSGGEFLVEILPFIKFNLLQENPKFVAGMSDPTGLIYPITTKYDIATIYGQNFGHFGMENLHQSQYDFLDIIKGNLITEKSYELYEKEYTEEITGLEGYTLTEKVYWKTLDDKQVSLKGRIIGGCFDVISCLAGTKYDGINEFNDKYKNDGIIWYFDNCELSFEETIRTLWKMNELGYFKYAKGIIFGRFGIEKTCCGYDIKTCLEDSVLGNLNIPVIYDTDISHKSPCMTVINGAIATVNVSEGKGNISFELK